MPRYTLTVAMNDNTQLTFDSKRAGGLDHLFEQVGTFINQVGNDNVRECLLTAVPEDQVWDAGIPTIRQPELHANHLEGLPLNLPSSPMVLERILSAQPVGTAPLLAHRMCLATAMIRNRSEWKPFLESEACHAYIRLLDLPIASNWEAVRVMKEGLIVYRQAMIDHGTEHGLLKPLIPLK